jgi:hypothetical protein
MRARFGTPVPREADGGQPAPKFRSPFTEDHPSPRCVWEDYKAGAAHYCAGMPLLYVFYWPAVFPPLVLNMFAASLHVMSVRPSYFWGATVIALLILVFAH